MSTHVHQRTRTLLESVPEFGGGDSDPPNQLADFVLRLQAKAKTRGEFIGTAIRKAVVEVLREME